MGCEKPLVFIKYGLLENGKMDLKMANMNKYGNLKRLFEIFGDKNIVLAPCGKCPSCITNRRREWSLRCEAEARTHEQNCFLTLTLENQYVHKVFKRELTDFIKSLRNEGLEIRYFGCGEYGDKTERPHYHCIIFGWFPGDAKYHSKSKTGIPMFTSSFLDGLWKKGFVTIQEFDPKAGGYVAGYVTKKLEFDPDEENKPFICMSTHPGLGYKYYVEHLEELLSVDNFMSKGGFAASLPRYFEKVAESLGYDITPLKEKRVCMSNMISLAKCQEHGFTNVEELFKYQGEKERRKKKYARNL